MARGWESKSVEEQQADKQAQGAPAFLPPSAQESERASLLSQRKRIEFLIESSTNPRYIEQQRKILTFLDEKLRLLS